MRLIWPCSAFEKTLADPSPPCPVYHVSCDVSCNGVVPGQLAEHSCGPRPRQNCSLVDESDGGDLCPVYQDTPHTPQPSLGGCEEIADWPRRDELIRRGWIVCAADAIEQQLGQPDLVGPHWAYSVPHGWSTPYESAPFPHCGVPNQRSRLYEASYCNSENHHDEYPTHQYFQVNPLSGPNLIKPFTTLRTLDPFSPISPISPATLQASEWARAGMMAISRADQWDGDEYMSMSE